MRIKSTYLNRLATLRDGGLPSDPNAVGRALGNWLRMISWLWILVAVPAVATVPAGDVVHEHAKFGIPPERHNIRPTGIHLFSDPKNADTSGGNTLGNRDLGIGATGTTRNTRADFDGDGRSDLSVFRPSEGIWYLDRSTAGFTAVRFGISSDEPTPADFDGDGKTDIAIYRGGEWWWIASATSTVHAVQFGLPDDIPVPADYTGDGRDEIAVYRVENYWDGQWWTLDLATLEVRTKAFGSFHFIPVVSDYDGDGKADFAAYRKCGPRSEWWYLRSSDNSVRVVHPGTGSIGDVLVPADYTGDGKTDVAYWQPSTGKWTIYRSEDGSYFSFPFGTAGDLPAPADYDGDRKADAAVYRPLTGTWWIAMSGGGTMARQFGFGGDVPIRTVFMVDYSGQGCWDY